MNFLLIIDELYYKIVSAQPIRFFCLMSDRRIVRRHTLRKPVVMNASFPCALPAFSSNIRRKNERAFMCMCIHIHIHIHTNKIQILRFFH